MLLRYSRFLRTFRQIFWVMAGIAAFLAGGFIYNVRVNHMIADWEAVPQINTIRYIGAFITIAVVQVKTIIIHLLVQTPHL
jgi:hypothetical protein